MKAEKSHNLLFLRLHPGVLRAKDNTCVDSNIGPKVWESDMLNPGEDQHSPLSSQGHWFQPSLYFGLIFGGRDGAHLYWDDQFALCSSTFQMVVFTNTGI